MRLTLQNHIVMCGLGTGAFRCPGVGQIINYTAETWQPDRAEERAGM